MENKPAVSQQPLYKMQNNTRKQPVMLCRKLNGKTLCIESLCQGLQKQIHLSLTLRFPT